MSPPVDNFSRISEINGSEASQHSERSDRQEEEEPAEEDLLDHLSLVRTDASDTESEESIKQPDFVVLARANDSPLYCHSVWEVKTTNSYGMKHQSAYVRPPRPGVDKLT